MVTESVKKKEKTSMLINYMRYRGVSMNSVWSEEKNVYSLAQA